MKTLEKMLLTGALIGSSFLPFSLERKMDSKSVTNAYAQQDSTKKSQIPKITTLKEMNALLDSVKIRIEEAREAQERFEQSLTPNLPHDLIYESYKKGYDNIQGKEKEYFIFNSKDGHEIRVNLETDLNYDEFLTFTDLSLNLSTTTYPGITIKLDDLYGFKLGEKHKFRLGNKDYKCYLEKIEDLHYFSLITKKSEWTKNGQPMGDLVRFTIEGLFRRRAEGIANNQLLFSGGLRDAETNYYNNKDYYVGQEPTPETGNIEFTIWDKDVIDNRDSRNYLDLKPIAVVYLGQPIPGSTSTPFSLEGKFYHAIFDIEYRKWYFEELK